MSVNTEPRDLSVKFGNQVRIKCICKKFVPHLGQIHCNCGVIWQQVEGTVYVRIK
jgi:hypothetical protein